MFVDALLLVSDAQALTATAFSTNTIDLGSQSTSPRVGTGEPLALAFQIDVAADFTTGDETYEIQIVSSANANLSSPTIVCRQALVASVGAASLLAAGRKYVIPIPPGFPRQRYLGVQYVLAGTTPTVTITAFFTRTPMADPEWTVYPKGYSI